MTTLTPNLIAGFVKTVLASGFEGATEIPDFHMEMWDLCCSNNALVAIAAPRG